jgi:hypothetical protein
MPALRIRNHHGGETMTDREALEALVEHLRDQADKCADSSRGPIHGSDYGLGVSFGLNYCADELEEVLQNES